MLSKADDHPIRQTPQPEACSTANRNFYDRCPPRGFRDFVDPAR